MKLTHKLCLAICAFAVVSIQNSVAAAYNFADLGIAKETHYDPTTIIQTGVEDQGMIDMMGSAYGSGFYTTQNKYGSVSYGAIYNNNTYMGKSWHGFAYSSMTNKTQSGIDGQFTSITGSGYNGSDNYLTFYGDGVGMGYNNYTDGGVSSLGMTADTSFEGLYITNTAYTYYSILNGDGYNTAFVEGDYFKLVITGYNYDGSIKIGSTSIFLANGTDILDQWLYVDILNSIGADVELLSFGFEQYTAATGTTKKDHGCKAPIYFALGGVETAPIPEPATYAFMFGSFVLIFAMAKKRK